ncbi:hypothetical protein WAE58_21715 [Pedobacter panaciterrae]|uniref:Glutaredoxin domain-containing protein n=1 Tax=Pedobacter panaciterrae TaxID=363849 RepID=A0ABU8NT31_9SPHI
MSSEQPTSGRTFWDFIHEHPVLSVLITVIFLLFVYALVQDGYRFKWDKLTIEKQEQNRIDSIKNVTKDSVVIDKKKTAPLVKSPSFEKPKRIIPRNLTSQSTQEPFIEPQENITVPQRVLDQDDKNLLKTMEKGKPVYLLLTSEQNECKVFMHEIYSYLEKEGYNVTHYTTDISVKRSNGNKKFYIQQFAYANDYRIIIQEYFF